jgi:predicted amidohydrolase
MPAGTRFTTPNGLELAAVGGVLVVAGDEEILAPYGSTQATLIVDDLDECTALLARAGAQVLRRPRQVPTGRNLTARLPGGVQIEYVERDRAQRYRIASR